MEPDPLPPNYRLITANDLTPGTRPYRRLAWLWVYYSDGKHEWYTRGTGVFLGNDTILTCAHIFGMEANPSQVTLVMAMPAHNKPHTTEYKPYGAMSADAVFACSRAFPPNRRLDAFNPEWDLAMVHLSHAAGDFSSPPFSPYAYEHLEYDEVFQKANSPLMTVGYGDQQGLMVESNLPIVKVSYGRNWLEVDRVVKPGQSGSPMFYLDKDARQQPEFRLIGIISCTNRYAQDHTYGTMITRETETWINRALVAMRSSQRYLVTLLD